ncbi:S8 family peptidase [Halobacillus mangrovi]|uniref:S8 family peptidase n=1 Tax=Halobacillus mangrovi TaxID=402384 RepID=UPI003D96E7F0
MKKYIGHLLLIVLIGLIGFPQIASAEETSERVIIGFENEIETTILEDSSHQLIHTYEPIDAISVSVEKDVLEELRANPKVKWVEKDRKVKATRQVRNWGFDATNTNASRDLQINGNGTKVAVIDTGINRDHPDLDVAGGANFVGDGTSYEDDNGHGTHVAGVINAQNNSYGTLGVAPAAKLYAVKSLDSEGIGNEADVIAGIQWAIEKDVDIINLSLTSPYSSTALKKMIDRAHAKGIFVVAASGNDKTGDGQLTEDVMYPGRYDNVISVGAVTEDLKKAKFSYQGKSLDFVAPGSQIYSTYIERNDSEYAYLSGTSMASPYVAGALALYKQLYPELSFDELEAVLMNNADDLGRPGRDDVYGDGLVQSPVSYFTDVENEDWFLNYVNDLTRKEWIQGYPDYTFRPQNKITRQEVVTLIGRSLDLDGTKRSTDYSDVNQYHYGSGFIDSATDKGIVEGFRDGTFRPDESMRRGDVALIIYRAFDIPTSNEHFFEDVNRDRYYSEAIHSLAKEGIINGYNGTEFRPEQPITRAEFATILSRTINPELRS